MGNHYHFYTRSFHCPKQRVRGIWGRYLYWLLNNNLGPSQYKDVVLPVQRSLCLATVLSLKWESHTWERRSCYWDGARDNDTCMLGAYNTCWILLRIISHGFFCLFRCYRCNIKWACKVWWENLYGCKVMDLANIYLDAVSACDTLLSNELFNQFHFKTAPFHQIQSCA